MNTVRTSVEWIFGEILNYFSFFDYKKNSKIEFSAVGKMYCVCLLSTNPHTCLYRSMTCDFFDIVWYWASNIGRIFHIGTFYQINLVVENIFAEPTEHSLWERFYMIVNPLLPLYRNQPINFHWKSMKWFLYNGKTGLKLVEEIKDPWNLSYSKVLYWPAYCVVKILAWLITVFMCGKSIVRRGVKIPHFG